jgi:hypothetical protein
LRLGLCWHLISPSNFDVLFVTVEVRVYLNKIPIYAYKLNITARYNSRIFKSIDVIPHSFELNYFLNISYADWFVWGLVNH